MRGEERLSGEKLDMQLDTSRGTFENAFGYVSPGVLVEAKRIERISASKYQIEDGKFTSCMQPSPRWSFSASSATLQVDDKVKATNVLFKVRDVPAFYIPYFIYPIQEDQRSTGLLFPHFGNSSVRGFNIGTGFFWAMNRSMDQTFYLDHYSKYGYGFGHEFRYLRPSPSRGNFRTYIFRRQDGVLGARPQLGRHPEPAREGAGQPARGGVEHGRVPAGVPGGPRPRLPAQPVLDGQRCSAASGPRWCSSRPTPPTPSSTSPTARITTFDRRRHLPSLLVSQSPRRLQEERDRVRLRGPRGGAGDRQPGPRRSLRPLRRQPARVAPALALVPAAHPAGAGALHPVRGAGRPRDGRAPDGVHPAQVRGGQPRAARAQLLAASSTRPATSTPTGSST